MNRVPWPHQVRTDTAVREAYKAGKRAILIVAPTGSGKTYMFCRLASGGTGKGSRVLVLAHREELIDQAAESLREEGLSPSIIAPWAPRESNTLQVGSIQTLLARGEYPDCDILVLDEAHHHVSPEWKQIPEYYRDRKALIIGATATPQRSDGVGLGNVFDHMVVACQPRELIASGHLVSVKVLRPSRMYKSLAEHPVQAVLSLASDRKRTIVFANSVQHAGKLAHEFQAMGIQAASVDGKLPRIKRKAIIDSFRRGDLRVLVNCQVLTEGFDARETDCVVLARGFSSEGAYMQACGRGMRRADGKTNLLVLDLKGCSHELGLPDDDRRFSLEGKAIRTDEHLEPVTQCQECGFVWRANEFRACQCPNCGYLRRGREDPAVRRQRLAEAAASDGHEDKIDYLSRRVVEALCKGWKLGAAKVKYALRYTPRGCPRKLWPHQGQLKDSGYTAAEAVLRELWMLNQTHHTERKIHIRGVNSHVNPNDLVDLIRQAIVRGESDAMIDGQHVRVRVAAELKETGT